MITQYSHQQVTLTDREKEYAWFNYAAEIIKAGCRDQSMSGYQVTGTGSDGKPVTVELTKEELFQIFAEVTTKLGKKFLRERLQEQEDLDLCQYFEHKKLKGYADFFNSSSSFCCGVI